MHLIISCSLNKKSRSRIMAEYASTQYTDDVKFIDLSTLDIPFCDGNECYDNQEEKDLKELVLSAKYLEKKADKFLKKGNTKKAEKTLAKAKSKYEKAFKLFIQSNKEKPNNPDTLNYLGFSSRKLGNFVEAEKYYLSGLSLKPNHNRINQYLGELYLNTNRKDKAIEQLEILKSCNCKEYDQLSDLIECNTVSKY